MLKTIVLLLVLVAFPALGQELPNDNPALKGLALALQQVTVAADLYATDMGRRLAARDVRLKEWEAYFRAYVGEPAVAAK
jgi:hypothetical protein